VRTDGGRPPPTPISRAAGAFLPGGELGLHHPAPRTLGRRVLAGPGVDSGTRRAVAQRGPAVLLRASGAEPPDGPTGSAWRPPPEGGAHEHGASGRATRRSSRSLAPDAAGRVLPCPVRISRRASGAGTSPVGGRRSSVAVRGCLEGEGSRLARRCARCAAFLPPEPGDEVTGFGRRLTPLSTGGLLGGEVDDSERGGPQPRHAHPGLHPDTNRVAPEEVAAAIGVELRVLADDEA
jgi:hypothetical protein